LEKKQVNKIADDLKKGTEFILIVEDEKSLLNITKKMLTKLGYQVITASSPLQGIELAEKYQGKIDLILSDVIMPEMNGFEMTEKIIEKDPGVQCLFMSGYTKNVVENNGFLNEGNNFITKPFSKKELALTIRNVLDADK
jgi:CheY-like chemotaxis protein